MLSTYFVMADTVIGLRTFSRRVGKSTTNIEVAKRLATVHRGYILDQSHKMVGQAFAAHLPLYVGRKVSIASGEDCFNLERYI